MFLDKETAQLQQKVSVRQLNNFWGKRRKPFLIVDSEDTIRNSRMYSARAAAIMGMRFFSTEMVFCLDSNMKLKLEVLDEFIEKHKNEEFVVFGFTFMVWKHLHLQLLEKGITADLHNGLLMTGGGWKKFLDEGVSHEDFKEGIRRTCRIERFMDHYGMAEQEGSIYLECEYGHYHASIFSDVITRRFEDFSPCKVGEQGIIQVVSVVPHSYPGNSILTEDIGVIEGIDDCQCGRKGKYVRVIGRIPKAEIRGCSDTYASRF